MSAMDEAGERARAAFEDAWRRGDAWRLHAELDRASRARQIALLDDRRYRRALEIGCGAGAFTRLLSDRADTVVAVDISPSAIERARRREIAGSGVGFRAVNIMDYDVTAEGPWDLVVMSETIYCLGWVYPLFEVGWLASRLLESLVDDGRLLMANTYGREKDYLLRPWLIDTYRDLLLHVGFRLEREETLRGKKGGVDFRVLISLFARPGSSSMTQPAAIGDLQ